jgi:NAD-dependent deacetylase
MSPARELPPALRARLRAFRSSEGQLVALTGAGISAESGIPTFRGKEGYWVAGSREYQPQEMATHQMFERDPELVWAWYLYRRQVCLQAQPNAGHHALVEIEQRLGDRWLLITQNVDGLHLRAGSSRARTYQIHGNVDFARCDAECGQPLWPLPKALGRHRSKDAPLSADEQRQLRCPSCEGWARPHVLWFDECYDEEHFRFQSSIEAAASAEILLVVGTSGATNLPLQVGTLALRSGAAIVDINPEANPFAQLAAAADEGVFLRGSSGDYLPLIAAELSRGS